MGKFLITEYQLKVIVNNVSSLAEQSFVDHRIEGNDVILNKVKQDYDQMRGNIINMIKNFKGSEIERDAYRHILVSAILTKLIGKRMTRVAGEFNELLGAVRNFIKGGEFDSGWDMDTKNNEIGIKLVSDNPDIEIDEIFKKANDIVRRGDFYGNVGKKINK